MRLSCLVNCDVGNVASSITSQNIFGMCFKVYPNRVISATCSARLYVGVIIYNGGGRILNLKIFSFLKKIVVLERWYSCVLKKQKKTKTTKNHQQILDKKYELKM